MDIRNLADGASLDAARDQLRDRPLRFTSAGRLWEGVTIDEYDDFNSNGKQAMPPRDHHVITIALGHSPFVYQERLGKTFESPCRPGETTMMPAGYETIFRGLLPRHIRIGLSLDRLAETADELKQVGIFTRPNLTSGFRIQDPWLGHLGAILSLELSQMPHPSQDLLIDSLSTALSAHLLRHYSRAVGIQDEEPSGSNIAAIRRILHYMEESPGAKISLRELAVISGLSSFHLIRVFKNEMGVSPMQYLEKLRIDTAKAMIRAAELSLADIAYAVGFADQSHFTRRFKRHAGCTPAAFAREHARRRLPPGRF